MVGKMGLFSALARLSKGRSHKEKSPFSSPYTGLLSSPVAARRSSLEERRRPAADFDRDVSPGVSGKINDGQEEEDYNVGEEQDEETEEDGDGEMSPLLPIFSAAHLGIDLLCDDIFMDLT